LSLLLFFSLRGHSNSAPNSLETQRKSVDAQKEQDDRRYSAPPGRSPIDELTDYIDRVFHSIRDKLKAGIRHSDRSAEELKGSLHQLQSQLDKEMEEVRSGTARRTKEELTEKRKALEKLRDHLNALGEQVAKQIDKTTKKINELSEQNERELSSKKRGNKG
jgi:DNA anti-recombination protein RmuC